MNRVARTYRSGRPPRHFAAVLALAALIAPSWLHAALPDFVTRPVWNEASTPRFVVISNAGQTVADDVARRLERLTQVMARVDPGARNSVPPSMRVLVLSDVEQVGAFSGNVDAENLAGFSADGIDGGWIVLAAGGAGIDNRSELLTHEYVHAYLRANLATLPAWLNEGLAQYYSTVRIQGTWAEVGRADPRYVEYTRRQDPMALDMLFSIDPSSRAYFRNNPLRGAFYMQSWALTHYLLSETGGRRERFTAWLKLLREGAPARRSFLEIFGEADHGVLHAESRAYLDLVAFEKLRRVEFPERLEDTPVLRRPLPDAEALTRLGSLLLSFGPASRAGAREYLERAIALDSTHAPALAARGFLFELELDPTAAESVYTRSLARGPASASAALWMAQGTLMRHLQREERPTAGTPPLLLTARTRFAHALALAPDDPRVLAGYGRTFVLDTRVDSTAIRALERALELQPGRVDVAADLANLKARAGDRASAERLFDRVAPSVPPSLARQASGTSDLVLTRQAEEALEQRRFAAAESLYTEVATWSRDPSAREAARGRAALARARGRGIAFQDLFDRGMAEAQSQRHANALRHFEQARDTTEDREQRLEAGRAIVQVRARDAVARARAAVAAKRTRDARALLDEALALPLTEEDRAHVQGFRAELEAVEELERAQGLVKAGRLREARAAYRAVADMKVSEEIRAHARQRAADLDKALGAGR